MIQFKGSSLPQFGSLPWDITGILGQIKKYLILGPPYPKVPKITGETSDWIFLQILICLCILQGMSVMCVFSDLSPETIETNFIYLAL